MTSLAAIVAIPAHADAATFAITARKALIRDAVAAHASCLSAEQWLQTLPDCPTLGPAAERCGEREMGAIVSWVWLGGGRGRR